MVMNVVILTLLRVLCLVEWLWGCKIMVFFCFLFFLSSGLLFCITCCALDLAIRDTARSSDHYYDYDVGDSSSSYNEGICMIIKI